jgi:hypothetical protein
MKNKWKRYALILRGAGVLVIVGLLVVVGYYLKVYYSDKMGATPQKAVETYFTALSRGDYDQVVAMTTSDSLHDIYGRPVTRAEFTAQLKRLTGNQPMPFTGVEATKLFEKEGVRYYGVTLRSAVGGTPNTSKLVVQVVRVDGAWRVVYPFAVFLFGE